jgi:hypothetical protein
MKIEKECYILKTEISGETLYLTEKYSFDNDIGEALKAKNMITAQFISSNIFQKYKCDLEIVQLKIVYEWQ